MPSQPDVPKIEHRIPKIETHVVKNGESPITPEKKDGAVKISRVPGREPVGEAAGEKPTGVAVLKHTFDDEDEDEDDNGGSISRIFYF